MSNQQPTFVCGLCGHEHDGLDELLALPGICGWCGFKGVDIDGYYSDPDPAAEFSA